MNIIIESISPSKQIQCVKKHSKWYNYEVHKLTLIKNISHKKAKNTNSIEDWRIFRNDRNIYNKAIKNAKHDYYSK